MLHNWMDDLQSEFERRELGNDGADLLVRPLANHHGCETQLLPNKIVGCSQGRRRPWPRRRLYCQSYVKMQTRTASGPSA